MTRYNNDRPETAYHRNDGTVSEPGSDGDLRMPPNTFEPVFNGLQAERQAVPAVARTNAYLGLINGNLIHNNWYVFNQLNYVRWPNVAMVDKIFAEFAELGSSILSPHTQQHPVATVVSESPGLGNIRTRAWRTPSAKATPGPGCVHLVVANTVGEGLLPTPAQFTVKIAGLTSDEVAAGASPTFGMGCVVNFTEPQKQSYICRHVPFTSTLMLEAAAAAAAATGGGAAPLDAATVTSNAGNSTERQQGGVAAAAAAVTLSDWIGVTDTTIYKIGCPLPKADATNYVADSGFEGGTDAHPMPGPPGVPGYNLDDHQAYWSVGFIDVDGVANGRSFNDATWLRMDTTLPHSGYRSGRIALPAGQPTYMQLPCERGDEHDTTQAKGDKVCKTGIVNVLNNTLYSITVWARTLHPGATLEVRHGAPSNGYSSNGLGNNNSSSSSTLIGKALVLGTEWAMLSVTLPAAFYKYNPNSIPSNSTAAAAVAGSLFFKMSGVAPGERAAVVWLDTVAVGVNSTSSV